LALRPAASAAQPVNARILTGTGAPGIDDGPPDRASFLMPSQIAVDARGTLVVTDTAAQRIRTVDPQGAVRTLAGGGPINASQAWVDGGYRDGSAADARFNAPDGVAVLPNGAVLVSDRDNHCVREIAGGRVSTYAGSPDHPGKADGPRSGAQFLSPRALTADKDGTVYVADWGVGVRKIANDSVSTLGVEGVTFDRPTGIALWHSGSYAALFVADARGLVRVTLPSLQAQRIRSFPDPAAANPTDGAMDAEAPLGRPYSVSAFDTGDVVITDLADSSVKYVRIASFVEYLGAIPPENAILTGGGPLFSPGSPEYDAPMGAAIAPDGTVYVADTGNRRIVRIEPFPRKYFVTHDTLRTLAFPPKTYRIAVVGSSFTWFASSVDDSIAGRLEADLKMVPELASKPASTRYFQVNLNGEFDVIDNVLSAGAADAVVLLISPIDPRGLNLGSDPAKWSAVLRARILRSAQALKDGRIPFLIVVNPAPETISPLESALLFDAENAPEASDYESEHAATLNVLGDVDVPKLDLYPAFRAELARPDRWPLFNSADHHYSPFGRALVASEIARKLEELHPWR
jgi:hypothetical protein